MPQCPPQAQVWPLLAPVEAHGSREGAGGRSYSAPVLGTISDSGHCGPLRAWGRQASSHAAGGDAEPEPSVVPVLFWTAIAWETATDYTSSLDGSPFVAPLSYLRCCSLYPTLGLIYKFGHSMPPETLLSQESM